MGASNDPFSASIFGKSDRSGNESFVSFPLNSETRSALEVEVDLANEVVMVRSCVFLSMLYRGVNNRYIGARYHDDGMGVCNFSCDEWSARVVGVVKTKGCER